MGSPTGRAGPGSARSVSVAPMRMSSSRRRPGRPRSHRFRTPQVLLLSPPALRSRLGRQAALAAALSRDADLSLPDVAFTLAGRRAIPGPIGRVVADHADACAVLAAAERQRLDRHPPRGQRRTHSGWRSCSPARRAAHRHGARPLRHRAGIPGHLRPLRHGFAAELGVDLKAEVFDGTSSSPPTWPSPRCSRWNTHWRNWSCRTGDSDGTGRTQHR